jgi:TrpR-related protein YerC/YecD
VISPAEKCLFPVLWYNSWRVDDMNIKLKDHMTDELFNAVLKLENIEECYDFFEDICTVSEIKALAQRLEVALMLFDGEKYTEIEAKTGASSATISRVNRSLNYGADGYKLIIERILKERKNGEHI